MSSPPATDGTLTMLQEPRVLARAARAGAERRAEAREQPAVVPAVRVMHVVHVMHVMHVMHAMRVMRVTRVMHAMHVVLVMHGTHRP